MYFMYQASLTMQIGKHKDTLDIAAESDLQKYNIFMHWSMILCCLFVAQRKKEKKWDGSEKQRPKQCVCQ